MNYQKIKDIEKEFRHLFSASLIDLTRKDEPTLGDIDEILSRQFSFIKKSLNQEYLQGFKDGLKNVAGWNKEYEDNKISELTKK